MGYREWEDEPYQRTVLDIASDTVTDIAPDELNKVPALGRQEGGSHYRDFVIQPVEFCHVNNIPYIEATAIKYLCRWRKKNGLEDLKKAKHFIEILIELESKDVNH